MTKKEEDADEKCHLSKNCFQLFSHTAGHRHLEYIDDNFDQNNSSHRRRINGNETNDPFEHIPSQVPELT